jgi:hypothetical protein
MYECPATIRTSALLISENTHHPNRGVGSNLTNPTGPFFKADSSTSFPPYFGNLNRKNTEFINKANKESITSVDNYADYAYSRIGNSSSVNTDSYTDNVMMDQHAGYFEGKHETKNAIKFELDNEGLFKKIVGLYVFVNLFIILSILFLKAINTVGRPL